MSRATKTLDRILRGNVDANIKFQDLRGLLLHLGFGERVRGDHHIFTREDIAEILNLQPKGSHAKPYQVKQVRAVLGTFRLISEPESEPAAEQDTQNQTPDQSSLENDDG